MIMPFHQDVIGRPGFLHGGAIAGLLEFAAFTMLRRELNDHKVAMKPITVTVDYMRGGTDAGLATFRGQRLVLDGDIITAIDGFPVHNFDELMGYLVSNTDVGQVVELTVLRNSEELTIDVMLDPRPNGAGD